MSLRGTVTVRYIQRMPSPEGPQAPSPEQGGNQPEHEPGFYTRAARFKDEAASGRAYFQTQEALRINPCDLSTYRLQLRHIWHVAVLGSPPPDELAQRIDTILAAGEAVTLPTDMLEYLKARRAQAMQQGPWVERHFRSKRRLR
jgi:hypothetical protein